MVKTITFSGRDFAIELADDGKRVVENWEFLKLYRETQHMMYSIVQKCYRFKVPLYENQDMLGEMNIAFLEAIMEYDPNRKASFSTFMSIKARGRIKGIYRDKIRLPLIKKYFSEEEAPEKESSEEKSGRALGQKNRWKDSAAMAYRLITATYMSEHEKNDSKEGVDYHDLSNTVEHSCSIDEDSLFERDFDWNEED